LNGFLAGYYLRAISQKADAARWVRNLVFAFFHPELESFRKLFLRFKLLWRVIILTSLFHDASVLPSHVALSLAGGDL